MTFPVLRYLQRHVRLHHNLLEANQTKKKFQCNICKKDFSTKENLKRHFSTVHQSLPNEKCKLCFKVFTDSKYLKKHMARIHLNTIERPKCTFCEKEFSSKEYLTKHCNIKHGGQPKEELKIVEKVMIF